MIVQTLLGESQVLHGRIVAHWPDAHWEQVGENRVYWTGDYPGWEALERAAEEARAEEDAANDPPEC